MAGAGYKLFNTGDVLLASEVNTYLMQQTVMVFADSAARTTALSGVLAEGMISYLADTNATEVYNGSAWVSVSGTGDITAVTTGANSGLAGGATSGAADIKINFASKGQLAVGTGSGTTDFLTVGTNGYTLVADSAQTTGVKWAVDPVADVVTTAGDILYATAADTLTRLGIGTAGQVLKVNSGATAPEWGAAGGASFVGCKLTKSAQQTVNNTTETAITWNQEEFDTDGFHDNSTNPSRITIPSGKAGKYLFVAANIWTTNSTGQRNAYLKKNGNTINSYFYFPAMAAGATAFIATNLITLAEGDYIELFGYHSAGTTINFDSDGYFACQYLGA